MTYIKWKDEVESYLQGMGEEEKRKVFSYFSEMYADKRDAGKSEEQIVEEFGAPYDVARKILSENRESAGSGAASQTPVTPPPDYSEPVYTPPPAYSAPAYTPPPAYEQPAQTARQTPPPAQTAKTKRRSGGKGWLIAICVIASILVLGLILFLVEVARNDWKLTVTYEMKTYLSTEDDAVLDLNLSAGEMYVGFYDGDVIEVEYPDSRRYGYNVNESNGTLSVRPHTPVVSWLGLNRIPAVVVRIPKDKVMQLDLEISAGKVEIADGRFTAVTADMSAGSTIIGNVKCGKFVSEISAGSMTVASLECTDFDLNLSAGSATVKNIACDKIVTDVSAGSVNLTVAGKKSDYHIMVSKSAGSCNVGDQTGTAPGKIIDLDISAGSITVNFTD